MVVRRSALRMWLLAIGGIPLLVIAVDVLTNRRITNWLRQLLFQPNETQIFEPRDVIWAWAMGLFAGFLVLWGLKELFVPTKVVEGRDDGLAIRLRGPLRGPDLVPWGLVSDITAGLIEEEETTIPALVVELSTRGGLPEHPWAARWVGERTLAVFAEDWARTPDQVAEEMASHAVEVARRQARARTASVWDEPS